MVNGLLKAAAIGAALALSSVSIAHAGVTGGSVWVNQASNSAATIPGTTPDATFAPGPIDYNPADLGSVYTLGAFLNNPTFLTDDGCGGVSCGTYNMGEGTGNTFFDFVGTVGLISGINNFVVAHDDGVVLNITGFGTVVNAPGPTAEDFTPFTVNNPGPAGNFAFNLQYAECCSPPAALVWKINDVVVTGGVPEPASWALMILGFGSAGAMLRRARKAAATATA